LQGLNIAESLGETADFNRRTRAYWCQTQTISLLSQNKCASLCARL
jgi:hypothetical protein